MRSTCAMRHGLVQAAADFCTRFGVADVVIANAGVSAGTITERSEDREVFQEILDVNVMGMVNTFQPFLARIVPRVAALWSVSPAWPVSAGCPGLELTRRRRPLRSPILKVCAWSCGAAELQWSRSAPDYIATPMTQNNPYRMPFIIPAQDAARRMVLAIDRRKRHVVIPWQMGVVEHADQVHAACRSTIDCLPVRPANLGGSEHPDTQLQTGMHAPIRERLLLAFDLDRGHAERARGLQIDPQVIQIDRFPGWIPSCSSAS